MNIFTIFQEIQHFFFDLSAKFQIFADMLLDWNPLAWFLAISGVVSISYLYHLIAKFYRSFQRAADDNNAAKNAHGSARFMTSDEIEDSDLIHNGTDRMILGSFKNHFVGPPSDVPHSVIVAPTGAGKGVGVVLPTILKYRGSVIVNDPKGENYDITHSARENMGQAIIRLNPWSENPELDNCSYVNPLKYIDINDDNAVVQARSLLRLICGKEVDGGANSYFYLSAEGLIEFSILLVKSLYNDTEKCNLTAVYDCLTARIEETTDLLNNALSCNHCGGEIRKAAGMYLDMYLDRKTGAYSDRYDSFRSNAVNYMKFLKDPQLRKFFEKDTCDLSFPQNDLSVFITISPEKQEGTEAYQRIIFGIIVEQQYIRKTDKMLPLLIILDEFALMGGFTLMKRAVGIARSSHMCFLFILQNREQLVEHYGKEGAHAFYSNATLCSFAPDSFEEQKYISDRLGNKTIFVESKSVTNGKTSTTTSSQARPIMTHDEVACSSKLFLFPRKSRPALINHIKFYEDSRFKGLYTPNKKK